MTAADGAQQAALRRVFLAPSWQDQDSQDDTQLLSEDGQPQRRPFDPSEQLWEPNVEPSSWGQRTTQRLRDYRSYSPQNKQTTVHWSQRPFPPGPPTGLTRSVQPSDLLASADACAARGSGYATHGDWRAAFRSYIVAAELLAQLLADVEPSQELRGHARRRMDVVVGIAEELREEHPHLLMLTPSWTSPHVVTARAWGELDEAAVDVRCTVAREENRAGNAQLKAGNNAEAVACYTASLELDATQPHVYGNRSVAFLRMDDLGAAVRDARTAVDLEPEAVARRAGVAVRRGVDGSDARRHAVAAGVSSPDDGCGEHTAEDSMAEAQRRFSQEVAQEIAELRACSIDDVTVQLVECAELGDAEGLLRAIGEGAKVDWGNPGWLDYTALHMASLHGHIEITRILLTAGANVSVIARDGSRPLHLAASPAVAVLLAEQPYADCDVTDREELTAVQRLVEEQGWASELLYEEGDVLICRPSGPVDIAATEIGRDVVATGINVHSKASCLQASIDPRHFRLCLVCERVRRKGGDRHDLFLARWYQAQASRSSGGTARPSKADVNTTFVLDDCNASFLVDTSDVFKRLRSGASGRDTEGSLVVRGVTLKSRGGQDGRDAAMLAGAALHSDATEMPEEMILTDQEWIEVVQTIIGSARSVINDRRHELEEAARCSTRDEEDRNAVFELACFTPQTFLAHGCKAGSRVCLLLADGRPARLPPGAIVCSVAVASCPVQVLTPKTAELAAAKACQIQIEREATSMAATGREPGEWCPSRTDLLSTSTDGDRIQGNEQLKLSCSSVQGAQSESITPINAAPDADKAESKSYSAVKAVRELIDSLHAESVAEQDNTTFDVGLLPIAELFPNAERKAVTSPTLPTELADSGDVAALVKGVSCSEVNRESSSLPRGAYGGGTAFGWGARIALAKPVDAKGFKLPTLSDAFLTLRLNKLPNGQGSDVVSGGVRVVVKFLLDQNARFYNTEASVSNDPRRPWCL